MTLSRNLGALSLAAVVLLTACGDDANESSTTASVTTPTTSADGSHDADSAEEIALHTTLRNLWSDHMYWTYATVDAFAHNEAALQPSLDRLLQNQVDMGDAIASFFGEEAGDALTALLTTHINQAIPVLQAAQAGDDAALDAALADWYANAQEIADFLSAANPDSWPQADVRGMLEAHIDTTTVYAVDLLGGDYAAAITHFDEAFQHMMMLSDVLAQGIIEQYPDRFETSS